MSIKNYLLKNEITFLINAEAAITADFYNTLLWSGWSAVSKWLDLLWPSVVSMQVTHSLSLNSALCAYFLLVQPSMSSEVDNIFIAEPT